MADASVFETGVLTDVWVPLGKNALGNQRFRRANFDVLNWDPTGVGAPSTFVVPFGLERISQAEIVLKDTGQVGIEFGYYGGESLFLDPSQGDGSDSVIGCNSFGFV